MAWHLDALKVSGDFSTPIKCERCGGKGHLVQRSLTGNGNRPGVRQNGAYACENCGRKTRHQVD